MIMLKQLYHTRMRRKGKMHLNGLVESLPNKKPITTEDGFSAKIESLTLESGN